MNQRTAVYQAIIAVVGMVEQGTKVELNRNQKDEVYGMLQQQFLSGEVDFKGERTPEVVKKYIPGLVNNWLRKDDRLNGGGKYQPKNPGSRAGSGDESLKAMKTLLAATTDPEARETIKAEITKRTEQLKPKKEINYAAIPESLRHLIPAEKH